MSHFENLSKKIYLLENLEFAVKYIFLLAKAVFDYDLLLKSYILP